MKKILVTLLLSSLFPVVAQAQPGVIRIPDKPISTTENPNIGKTADFNLLVTRMEKMEKEMKALTTRNEALQKRVSELETLQKADDSGKLPLKMVVSGLDATVNKLVKQQAEDDKNTLSVKLLLTGLDKSVTELKGLFEGHVHQTKYSYITFDDLLGNPAITKVTSTSLMCGWVLRVQLCPKLTKSSRFSRLKAKQEHPFHKHNKLTVN